MGYTLAMTAEAETLGQFASDLHRRLFGHRPREVRAYLASDHGLVVLVGVLTQVERALAVEESAERVESLRRRSQKAVENELIAKVETLTGMSVCSLQWTTDIEQNLSILVFVLEPSSE